MVDLPTPSDTLLGALAHAVEQGGLCARFVDRHEREETWTFEEIWSRARSSAGALIDAGIVPGDRVLVVCPTEVGFYDAFFGTLMAGAIPTPAYPPVRLGRVEEWVERTTRLVESVEAAAIVADRRSRRLLGQVVGRISLPAGVLKLEELASHTPVGDIATARADDLALIQFSSGTTRIPAPVTLTNRQILANIEAIVTSLPDEALQGGGCVSWLPLYHDMGLIGCLLTAIRCGQPMTLIPPEVFLMRPAIWLRALSTYRGTVSPAPNFAYARCADKIEDDELEGVDLSGWVVAMNGAEPISPLGMRRFEERFARFGLRPQAMTPVYGLAEAALAVSFSRFDTEHRVTSFRRDELGEGRAVEETDVESRPDVKPSDDSEIEIGYVELPSLGGPLPGYELEVRTRLGGRCNAGEVGRLWVRGPSVTGGYFGGDSPVQDGWLDTGDLAFFWNEELYVCGRAKDVIVVRGRNHAPFELERACDVVDGMRTGCAVAVSEIDHDGEKVHLFVEVREWREGLEDEFADAVRSRSGIKPDHVHLLEPGTLPRTSSGKLRRAETLRRFKTGELAAPKKVTTIQLASEVARSAWGYLKR